MIAKGTFEITTHPEPPYDVVDGVTLAHVRLEKRFTGALDAASSVHMIGARTPVGGSAGYVAIERVTGALEGKRGTFVLQHSGVMTRGAPSLHVTIVPDSGTGALAGISGRMDIQIVEGQHFYDSTTCSVEPPRPTTGARSCQRPRLRARRGERLGELDELARLGSDLVARLVDQQDELVLVPARPLGVAHALEVREVRAGGQPPEALRADPQDRARPAADVRRRLRVRRAQREVGAAQRLGPERHGVQQGGDEAQLRREREANGLAHDGAAARRREVAHRPRERDPEAERGPEEEEEPRQDRRPSLRGHAGEHRRERDARAMGAEGLVGEEKEPRGRHRVADQDRRPGVEAGQLRPGEDRAPDRGVPEVLGRRRRPGERGVAEARVVEGRDDGLGVVPDQGQGEAVQHSRAMA